MEEILQHEVNVPLLLTRFYTSQLVVLGISEPSTVSSVLKAPFFIFQGLLGSAVPGKTIHPICTERSLEFSEAVFWASKVTVGLVELVFIYSDTLENSHVEICWTQSYGGGWFRWFSYSIGVCKGSLKKHHAHSIYGNCISTYTWRWLFMVNLVGKYIIHGFLWDRCLQ